MYTIAIANQKGGVSKTTTAAAIAQGLTAAGYKVLAIDADPQANLSDLLQAQAGKSLFDVIQGAPLSAAIQQTTTSGYILPSEKALASPKLQLKPTTLQQILKPAQAFFHVAIIDTPPSLGALTVSALMAADGVLVPTKADKFSLSGLQELYASMKAVNPQLPLIGVIVTQYNGRATLNKAVLEALQEQAKIYHSKVLQPPIRRTVAAEEWQYTGTVYGDKSTAGEDYAAIVKQIPKLIKLKRR